MEILIRDAAIGDAPSIVAHVKQLAKTLGEASRLTDDYTARYMTYPGNTILVAETHDGILGLLSYSIRPNLYHSGDVCLIEEMVVMENSRSKGIGARLLEELLTRMSFAGCAEISVSTLPENHRAIEFYRKHGFTDEGTLLEIHPPKKENNQ